MSTIINIYSSIKSTLSLLLSLSALYNMEIPISTIPMDTRMEVDSENHRKNEKLVTMGELHQEFFGQKNDKAKRCSELVRSNGKEYVHPANQVWREFGLNYNCGNYGREDLKGKICMMKQRKEGNSLLANNSFSCYTPIILQDKKCLGLVDTGSDISVVNRNFIIDNKVNFYTKHGLLKLAG